MSSPKANKQNGKQTGLPGVLGRIPAIILALNLAVMIFTPMNIFADSIDNIVIAQTGTTAHWSLVNFLAVILASMMLLLFIIKMVLDRPNDDCYLVESASVDFLTAMAPEQRMQYQKERDARCYAWAVEENRPAPKTKILFVNAPVLSIAVLALIEALVMFFVTQDLTSGMIVVDSYTALFVLVVLAQLLVSVIAAVIHNDHRSEIRSEIR